MIKSTFVVLVILLTLSIEGILFRDTYGEIELGNIIEFDGGDRIKINSLGLDSEYQILVKNKEYKRWYSLDNNYIYLTTEGSNYLFLMKANSNEEYDILRKTKVVVTNPAEKFLHHDQDISSDDERIALLAIEITKNIEKEDDKAKAIYHWMIDNIEYDFKKYKEHQKNNYQNSYGSLATLDTLEGVCYDYATLYAALNRSIGIPTKVVEGDFYLDDGSVEFHAWNQIHVSGQWINVDATLGDTLSKDLFGFAYGYKYIKIREY